MNKQEFFELITDYVAKKHPSIYMEAVNSIEDSHFLNYNSHAEEELKEKARDFLRLFGLKYEI